MAPAQARGEVNTLDERCDVFGLGSMLCQILTGKPPYTVEDASALPKKARQARLATGAASYQPGAARWAPLRSGRDQSSFRIVPMPRFLVNNALLLSPNRSR